MLASPCPARLAAGPCVPLLPHPSVRSAELTVASTVCFLLPCAVIAGENYELKSDLHSESKEKRADAIKRTVASMTVGKDVSGLFPDILVNMVSTNMYLVSSGCSRISRWS